MRYPSEGQVNSNNCLLELKAVGLVYGSVKALSRIDLKVGTSEIRAIVGEHGAGKSSLAKVISGMVRPNSGNITFDGITYTALSTEKARSVGVEMIYQEMQICSYLRVVDTFFLRERSLFSGFFDHKAQTAQADRFLKENGYPLDTNSLLKDLPPSQQLIVEILKSLFQRPKLLILDEVFERLPAVDLEKILAVLRRMRKEGMSILLITHRIDDVYSYADKVSVLKDGEILLSTDVGSINRMNLIEQTYTQISQEEPINDLSKEFYQHLKYNEAILQFLPIILIVVDGENNIKMVNQYARSFFGIEQHELPLRPVSTLFTNCDSATGRKLDGALRTRSKRVFYAVSLDVNDRKTVNNIIFYPIKDRSFIIGRIIIIEDMTEHERMRDQLIVSEKLASVGLLAAGVAHEINNPLATIANYIQGFRFRQNNAVVEKRLVRVEEQIQYITNIVSDLLVFSDTGRIAREEIDLNELISDLLGLVKFGVSKSGIQIRFWPAPNPLLLYANRNELKQVVLNLVRNSCDALIDRGTIDISTEHNTDNDRSSLTIRVRDDGPGIRNQNMNDIFLPFSSTRKDGSQHLGLGLYVSYSIVKKYHGEIGVTNLRRGCEFTVSIPQASPTHAGMSYRIASSRRVR